MKNSIIECLLVISLEKDIHLIQHNVVHIILQTPKLGFVDPQGSAAPSLRT